MMDVSLRKEDFKKFPTTRYQGSKRKIVDWIYQNVRKLEFETVLDACGGSGSVSYLFKRLNKTVTYNDKLTFNYQIGKALIENNNVFLNSSDIENILNNSSAPIQNFIEETFKGYYYLDEENRWLDLIIPGITTMNSYPSEILQYKKSLALYALYQACLTKRPFNLFHRKNLNIRTNDVERNFGNKTTWEKDFSSQFVHFANEVNSAIFPSLKECKAINKSVFEIEQTDFDLVYIDPPYITKNGRNETLDYLKSYHFLEGISNFESWKSKIDFNTRNLRFKDLSSQNDFKKDNVHQSLQLIFEKFQKSILVLSYKQGGIPTINELQEMMGKFKKRVYIESRHYKYALNRQNGDAKKNREVLIIGI